MNFSQQIKSLRAKHKMTQQEMADRLGISRQAISNWENDRNLPDIEMLISLSRTFDISLDELILGESNMTNMTRKLIDDTSKTRRTAMNLRILKIAIALIAFGFICFLAAVLGQPSWENLLADASRISFLGGLISFVILGAKNILELFKAK
ncbi:helix-turn-helix transcriptional regulator [Streptococcus loxodontisalivarius]|uniref:Transcriptional regulator with XRE-family HTH domain n=1 Tax=Streptococcus loxodontisalivarius TaxID=1349415 RepID=A0ABS2PPI2_9STRE|nr:helix-turn-helix transcriptional regulator [Streptococcus loxodontisalivarius]MBM7641942.1 transcriptional regulator with XRE-family HTH domain [Streptococcus loxodontisalivarius]